MPVNIVVPSVGESISEVVLSRWLKADGEAVRRDEPVAELESEKATQEVPAPAAGRLKATVAEGATVGIGAVIGSVDESAAAAAAPAPEKAKPQAAETPAAPAALSPAARVHAEVRGVSAEQLTGTGRGGRITKQDVLATNKATNGSTANPLPPAPPAHPAGRETRKKMSPLRQRIATRLVESQQTTASLTTFNEADLSAVFALRARYKEGFQKKHGVGLGLMSFFVKAAVEALQEFPDVNARIDGSEVVYQNYFNVGVAVSTDKGLMVPVLRDADRMTFAEVEHAIAGLAAKARDGKIAVSDLQGGTFTITNGGVFGSLMATPILNPPQTGILGMHAVKPRPVVVDDQIVIRPMMYLALTYDHRLIDGRESVQFLVRVKECIENPERLMLGV
jgi:2-oxoglutarate dehydrogenase E2 component (dihydrolipoamide succinyltransferase)